MNEMMDDLVTAAKATGCHTDPGHLEADLMTGWAYRLLEEFGTAMDLSFDSDCPGRQYLKRNKVPDDFIPAIAETFRQERKFARTHMFEAPLKGKMDDVGLDATRLNVERARCEIFRAKADVLLNTRSLYPQPDPAAQEADWRLADGKRSSLTSSDESGASAIEEATETPVQPSVPENETPAMAQPPADLSESNPVLEDETVADGSPRSFCRFPTFWKIRDPPAEQTQGMETGNRERRRCRGAHVRGHSCRKRC